MRVLHCILCIGRSVFSVQIAILCIQCQKGGLNA